ncbi:hypothetical protein D3C81_1226860 [compost metagenome]
MQIHPSDSRVLVARSERMAANDALQIELSLARAALERGDQQGWQQALDRTDAWLLRLWPESPQRKQHRDQLRAMRDAQLRPAIPELGSTLQQLRATRAAKDIP